MINLLPHEARKLLIRDYSIRVGTVWAFLWTVVFLAIAALFLPSYLLIESEKKAFEAETVEPNEAENTVATIEQEVKAANELAAALKGRMVTSAMSDLIRAVTVAAPVGVTLRAYEARRNDHGIESIRINGVAVSREALTAFEQNLEAREEFKKAEVPIDDFVKEKDLPFEITISVADNFR